MRGELRAGFVVEEDLVSRCGVEGEAGETRRGWGFVGRIFRV